MRRSCDCDFCRREDADDIRSRTQHMTPNFCDTEKLILQPDKGQAADRAGISTEFFTWKPKKNEKPYRPAEPLGCLVGETCKRTCTVQ